MKLQAKRQDPKAIPKLKAYFIKSNTADVIAFTPVLKVGSGTGANIEECSDGKAVPPSLLAFTFAGSTAPNQKIAEGIF